MQAAHPLAEVPFRGFDQQMVMIIHQTIGITTPMLLSNFFAKQRQESATVCVIEIDILPPITTSGDMLEGPLYSRRNYRAMSERLPGRRWQVKQ